MKETTAEKLKALYEMAEHFPLTQEELEFVFRLAIRGAAGDV
jgi:hypothetical protein